MITIRSNGFASDAPRATVVRNKVAVKSSTLSGCVEFSKSLVETLGEEYCFDMKGFIDRMYDVRTQGIFISKVKGEIPFVYSNEIEVTLTALVEVGAITPLQYSELRLSILGK